jgi:hypothetical protein
VASGLTTCTTVVDDAGAWSCDLALADGVRAVVATATDAAGNRSDPVVGTMLLSSQPHGSAGT